MSDDGPRYETLEEEDAARRARAPKKRSSRPLDQTVGIGIGVVVLALGFWWCSSAASSVPFSAVVLDYSVIDEANLEVVIEFTNDGDEPAKAQCMVEAHDASRVTGFDILASTSDIEPGESVPYRGSIRIEDEGAFRVIDVTLKDCGED